MYLSPLKIWLNIVCIFFILTSTTGLTLLLSAGGAFSEGSFDSDNIYELFFNYINFFILIISILITITNKTFYNILENKIGYFFLGYFYIFLTYIFFGNEIDLSFVFNYAMFILILSIVFFRYGASYTYGLIFRSLNSILIFSLIFIIFFPQYGVSVGLHEGSWQGVFTHKNQFGIYLYIYILYVLFGLKVNYLRTNFYIFLFFSLAIFFVFMSNSSTCLFLTIISISIYLLDKIKVNLVRSIMNGFLFKVCFTCFVVYFILNSADIMSLFLNKVDAGYSNRDLLWFYGFSIFLDNLWFGLSNVKDFDITQNLTQNVGFKISNFHNSYIEVLARFGIFGFFIILMPLFYVLFYGEKNNKGGVFLSFGLLFPLMIYMFMESFYLGKSLVVFILFIIHIYFVEVVSASKFK